jgi:hypothetical protein
MASTLEAATEQLARAIALLERFAADLRGPGQLLRLLGWDLPPGVRDIGLARLDLSTLADRLEQLDQTLASATADDLEITAAYVELAVAAAQALDRLQAMAAGFTATPEYLARTRIKDEFLRRLLDLLVVQWTAIRSPPALAVGQLLGILLLEPHAADPERFQVEHVRCVVRWDRLPLALTDPGGLFREVYGWGTADFDADALIGNLAGVLLYAGVGGRVRPLPRRVEERLGGQQVPEDDTGPAVQLLVSLVEGVGVDPLEVGVSLFPLQPTAPGGDDAGLGIGPYLEGTTATSFPLAVRLALQLEATVDLRGGVALVLRPDQEPELQTDVDRSPAGGSADGRLLATLRSEAGPDRRHRLLSLPGVRLDAASLSVGGGATSDGGQVDALVVAAAGGGRLLVSPDGLDGFLASLLPGDGLQADFDLAVSWSSSRGLTLQGTAGLQATIAVHREIGPFRLDAIQLALRGSGNALELEATIVGGGSIGPVGVTVEGLGLLARLRLSDGNLGLVDLDGGFQPPTGLGLVVDAGPISGGGTIRFEPDRGRYVGMVELDAYEIEITAIAILETKDAAGRDLPAPGFSFLMLVAVELPPIQLGFGFTLNGVGGLVGINRRLDAPALLAGVRSGAVSSLLFPDDPVRDAPVILGHLGTIFPIAVGRHVFAPMALIGWGTPTLIDIELAVVLEVPAPVLVALIGQASVRLPDDPPVVVLNVDVVGVLDYGRSLFALDASLRDSRVAGFPLAGDLAMRLGFGADPSFALAVGGFNPHFEAPPGFPTLRRVSLALGQGDNPRVSIEGYLAVTSNSLQFGAKAELFAEAGSVNVKGWLAFDALFVFEPFSFRFDFAAGMSLNRGSRRLAGVTVSGTLTGPNPFHAWGEGCLSLLFFDICVPFDATFGTRRDQPALPPADPWGPLRTAIGLAGNWSTELPPGAAIGVTLRRPQAATGVLVHPMGVATLRQRVVPLNRTLERFGQFPITGPDRFDVVDVLVGDDPAGSWRTVTEHFAPGDFEALSPTEQLSRDSFEEMDAGVRVGTDTVEAPADERKTAPVVYETKIIDALGRVRPLGPFRADRLVQVIGASTGAKARSVPGAGGRRRFARDDGRRGGVRLEPERYTVATKATLAPRAEVAAGVTRGAAHLALKHAPATAARDLQVVPAHELDGG